MSHPNNEKKKLKHDMDEKRNSPIIIMSSDIRSFRHPR